MLHTRNMDTYHSGNRIAIKKPRLLDSFTMAFQKVFPGAGKVQAI